MGRRGVAAALAVALVLAACSGAEDDTDVLGTVVEAMPTATPARTATPAPTQGRTATPAPTQGRTATPAPTRGRTATPAPTQGRTATPAPTQGRTATRAPAPPPPPPAAPPPTPEIEPLLAGLGWSTNTLLPDEGGEAWTEVSGQAPLGEDGTLQAHLFVTLVHEPVPGDSAGRLAHCRAWLEAAPAAALRADGEVSVSLLVGGAAARAATYPVDSVVAAGARADLPSFQRPERVHALGGEAVTCTVTYTPSPPG